MGVQEKSTNAHNSLQRVKVYRLNADGTWDDQGTGHIAVDYLERTEDMGLFVVDEEDNETLLLHRISSDDIYQKQEDTIISWKDPEFSTELAISFQETTSCSYIWPVPDLSLFLTFSSFLFTVKYIVQFIPFSRLNYCRDHICNAQRNMQFSSLTNDTFQNINNELRELPPVELSTLPLIVKIVLDSGITDQMRVSELIMHDQDFFCKLKELFRICEDLENFDGLHLLFKIIRGIILLNNAQIFEKMFDDEVIMDIIGCLEYDPEVPRVNHRNFLKEHVIFKEAIPIKNPTVISRIHQTYRVSYLKDVIFPRALDESVVASLNSIIHSNNAIIVSLLKDDSSFIKELFARLKSPTVSAESKKTLVQFLHEFCTLSKSLQMVHQVRIYRDLVSEGIFDIIADILKSEDKKLVLTGTDILTLFLNQDPNILRSYVAGQEGVILGLLVKGMLTDFGDDMHCQFLEILRSLLDTYTSSGSQSDTTIVEIFYEKHLVQLIDVIFTSSFSCPPPDGHQIDNKSMRSDGRSCVKPEILLNICDLLCFCVLHHPYRIKCSFLLNNVIDKILYLTKRREKYIVVAAVRFLRTLISRSDEHVMNHIVKNNTLKPIINVFIANGDRYNLLNSAVLELFEYIQKENLKVLLRYLIDTFWDQLVKFEDLSSIHALKVKYEQSLESAGITCTNSLLNKRNQIDERALEKEENYFNEESNEEDSASAQKAGNKSGQPQPPVLSNGSSHPSPRSGGLVDYEDDEDDEDYRPPPKKTEPSDEDDGATQFMLKRRLVSEDEPQPKRSQQSPKGPMPREGVFASLCSTLCHTVLPSKKAESQLDSEKNSTEPNIDEKGSLSEKQTVQMENHTDEKEEASRSFTKALNDSADNWQQGEKEERNLLTNPSPETAVNGSLSYSE